MTTAALTTSDHAPRPFRTRGEHALHLLRSSDLTYDCIAATTGMAITTVRRLACDHGLTFSRLHSPHRSRKKPPITAVSADWFARLAGQR